MDDHCIRLLATRTVSVDQLVQNCVVLTVTMLRARSECLPIVVGAEEPGDPPYDPSTLPHQAVLWADDTQLVLGLRTRKNRPVYLAVRGACDASQNCNRPWGSKLVRRCWCGQCSWLCPVHVIGKRVRCDNYPCPSPPTLDLPAALLAFARMVPAGTPLFGHLSRKGGGKEEALKDLRGLLAAVGVRDAKVMRTHDIRRGHERDIKDSGGRLCELRAAAGWSERG